jgi:hypothetical protein
MFAVPDFSDDRKRRLCKTELRLRTVARKSHAYNIKSK